MSNLRFFVSANRRVMIETQNDEYAQRYAAREDLIEVTEEEFDFIDEHWPDDPEYIARYGTLETDEVSK